MKRTPEEILDELLVLRSQDGDRQAWRNLVARWNSRLWAQAFQSTGRADVASDLTQETWLAVLRGIDRLQDPERFPSWISRIMANKITDWARRSQSEKGAMLEQIHRIQQGQQSDVDQQELQTDRLLRLRVLIRQLDEGKRELLTMFYLRGMSLTEISQALHIPEGTVKSRLYSLRQELKELIEASDHDGN